MNLIEKELSEEFTRILNANNPHAPQNISRYSNKENTFKTVANMEHVSFHFEFDGCVVFNRTTFVFPFITILIFYYLIIFIKWESNPPSFHLDTLFTAQTKKGKN